MKNELKNDVAVILFLVLVWSAYAVEPTNVPDDLVGFFKRAVASPPDIKEFIIAQRLLPSHMAEQLGIPRQNSFQYYRGARAGSNFIITATFRLTSPHSTNASNQIQFADGRAGSVLYSINKNEISYGIGTNTFVRTTKVSLNSTRQLLNMGLADIIPETVVWSGNHFSARNDEGSPRYGELVLSNNLPVKLSVSDGEGSPPLKTIEYSYPKPPTLLSGFPARILISGRYKSGLEPIVEITVQHVQLATQPLPREFFEKFNNFIKVSITSSNLYSNAFLYVSTKNGRMVNVANPILEHEQPPSLSYEARAIFYVCLGLTTLASILLWLRSRKQQTN